MCDDPLVWSGYGFLKCVRYDEVYVQQIGPERETFFSFYEKEVLPALR